MENNLSVHQLVIEQMEYIHAMEYYLAIKKERTVKIPANF
jgi:hypothetical protein